MILDSSALMALVLNEPGAERVEAALEDAVVSAVNLAETVTLFARRGFPAAEIRELLDPFRLEVAPMDTARAHAAGLLEPVTRAAGLSLGDRACLALAIERGLPALTGDRAWLRVADALQVRVELFR
jgi:PIN domain nuclease of toxin-antitoxin system